jgi:hypothetical protein
MGPEHIRVVQDYGFYGSNVSNALDAEVLNAVLRSRRHRRYKRRVISLYLSGLRARIARNRAG